jgi:hypothetical protein
MKRTILLLTLIAALPLGAQSSRRGNPTNSFASDFQTVPVMGNVPGVGGARFQTYVAILNPTTSAFPVSVALYDSNGTRHDATINLAAGEMKTYSNFLDAVFGGYQGGGAVTFRTADTPGGTHNNRIVVVAQSYTAGTKYGTTLPSLEFTGTGSKSYAPGVNVNSDSRTNVGCFDQSGAPNLVHATVYDASGKNVIGTVDLNLPGNAWQQTAVTSVITDGYIQFAPSDAAVCYAVVVNNTTNDAHFIGAAEYTP